MQFLHHLAGLFNLLLLFSGLLSFVLQAIDRSSLLNLYLGIVLVVVAVMNAAIEFYQEYKSAAILDSFKVQKVLQPTCFCYQKI